MSKRAWIAAFAFGLALTIGSLAQEKPPEEPVEPSATQQEPAEQPAMEVEPVAPEVAPTEPASAEHDQGAAEDRAEDAGQNGYIIFGDGIAQWVMAATGVAAFFLSAWAVWLLSETLIATKETLNEASQATQLAKRSLIVTRASAKLQLKESKASIDAVLAANEIAERTAISEQRPWIKIRIQVKEDGIWVNADGFGVEYVPEIENVGNTPAFDVMFDNMLLVPSHPRESMGIVNELRRKIQSRVVMEGQAARGITVWPHSRAPFDKGGMGRSDKETAARVAGALLPNHSRTLTCFMLVSVVYKFGDTSGFTASGFRIDFTVPEEAAGKHSTDVVRIGSPSLVREDGRFSVAE